MAPAADVLVHMLSYVVISPARDEQQHIRATLDSMLAQTHKPLRWIIIDDGSIDGTAEIVEEYCRRTEWISLIRRQRAEKRQPGSPVIRAFHAGLELARKERFDLVVKLDCDLRIPPHYFEDLLSRFQQDAHLGIASGVYREEQNGGWEKVPMPEYHAAGACKVVRTRCFEEIGGFLAVSGWDTIDEIRAQGRGWRTRHFTDLTFDHLRPEGSARGQLYTSRFHGEVYYLSGGPWTFFLLKVAHRIITGNPPVLAGAMLFIGYLKPALLRRERLVSRGEAKLYRQALNLRMRNALAASIRRLGFRLFKWRHI
jgi:glycosyltransferase involved in cell wall biosynthesis